MTFRLHIIQIDEYDKPGPARGEMDFLAVPAKGDRFKLLHESGFGLEVFEVGWVFHHAQDPFYASYPEGPKPSAVIYARKIENEYFET